MRLRDKESVRNGYYVVLCGKLTCRRQYIVDENEYCFFRTQLDSFSNNVYKLPDSQIRGYQIPDEDIVRIYMLNKSTKRLFLINVWNIASICLFANYLSSTSENVTFMRRDDVPVFYQGICIECVVPLLDASLRSNLSEIFVRRLYFFTIP